MNTKDSEKRLKKGFVRDDGMILWSYDHGKPYFVSPEKFAEKKQRQLESDRKRRQNPTTREKALARMKEWWANNAQDENYREKKRLATLRWRRDNPEKARAGVLNWRKNNRHMVVSYNAKRRAMLRGLIAELTPCQKAIVHGLYETSKRIESCLGVKFHVDHILPLAAGGRHEPGNLQVLPARVNLRKGVKV